jgi:hypothetical protein
MKRLSSDAGFKSREDKAKVPKFESLESYESYGSDLEDEKESISIVPPPPPPPVVVKKKPGPKPKIDPVFQEIARQHAYSDMLKSCEPRLLRSNSTKQIQPALRPVLPSVAPVAAPSVAPSAAPSAAIPDKKKMEDRQYARESEKRFVRIQSVCRFICGAFFGIMLAHILSLFVEITYYVVSTVSNVVCAAYTEFWNVIKRVCHDISSGFLHVCESIKKTLYRVAESVKQAAIALYNLIQTISTLLVIGYICYNVAIQTFLMFGGKKFSDSLARY